MANPFDGLTPRQKVLVQLALDFMRLLSWSGDSPPPREKIEYEELLAMLGKAAMSMPDLEDPNNYLLIVRWRIEEAEEKLKIAREALDKYLKARNIEMPGSPRDDA